MLLGSERRTPFSLLGLPRRISRHGMLAAQEPRSSLKSGVAVFTCILEAATGATLPGLLEKKQPEAPRWR